MSKKHKKHLKIEQKKVEEKSAGNGIVGSFSDKIGVPLTNANDLMNWIIFGDPNTSFSRPTNENEF